MTALPAPYDTLEVPRVDWDTFKRGWPWNRGEHVTILGPTGSGKTYLMSRILDKHPDVVLLNLKPNDRTVADLLPEPTWQRITHWPPPQIYRDRPNWVVLKPKRMRMEEQDAHQARVVRYALRRIWEGPPGADESEQGCWTIAIPDLFKVLNRLKVGDKHQEPSDQLEQLYTEGRGMRISLVIDAQSTAWLQRLALDQPGHYFMFRPRDADRANRYAEIGNQDKKKVLAALSSLKVCEACRTKNERLEHLHEVLYVPSNGDMAITVPR